MNSKRTANDNSSPPLMPTTSRRLSVGLVALALLPCLASWFFATADSESPPLTITRTRPSLLFSTYLYHHGEDPVEPGVTLNSEFRFRNQSSTTVTIDKVERSCGCMTPRWTKKVEPGQIGSLQVPLETIRQSPGYHEYDLIVHYSDPKPHTVGLRIKATFPEKMLIVQPRALYLSQRSSKPFEFNVAVSDFRDDPLRVKRVEATASFVSAKIRRKTISDILQASHAVGENGEFGHEPGSKTDIVGTVAGSIPPGRHHVLLTATTDDAEFSVVTVPMIVNGPQFPPGQEAELNISSVRLVGSDHPGARREGSVLLEAPTSWEISHATAWPEELEVRYEAFGEPDGNKQKTLVRIKLAKLPASKPKHGLVQLIANDGQNLVTVQVTFDWPE